MTKVTEVDTPYLKAFKLQFNNFASTKMWRRIDKDRVSLCLLNPYIKFENLRNYKGVFDDIAEV